MHCQCRVLQMTPIHNQNFWHIQDPHQCLDGNIGELNHAIYKLMKSFPDHIVICMHLPMLANSPIVIFYLKRNCLKQKLHHDNNFSTSRPTRIQILQNKLYHFRVTQIMLKKRYIAKLSKLQNEDFFEKFVKLWELVQNL